ncbi:MAG: S8 family serine peptidase, partial [Verrucomicrobiales bacterium]|nr:S8 family serine peptidase [Verrucomicrobiales bacterium]
MKTELHLLPTNVQVGCVTPCAPQASRRGLNGAHRVTRPTACARFGAWCDLNRGILTIPLLMTFAVCLPAQAASHYAERELLVKWKDGPDSYAAAVGNAEIGSAVKRNFNEIGWQHVQLPEGLSVRDGIEAYQALGTVSAVEPNGIIEPILPPAGPAVPSAPGEGDDATAQDGAVGTPRPTIGLHAQTTGIIPNDSMFKDQWYLRKIGATNAWTTTTGSSNVVVAIIDSGVDYTHPDLAANMWRNPGETGLDSNGQDKAANGVDDDDNGYVDDVFGADMTTGSGDPMDHGAWQRPFSGPDTPVYHGTFIAGLIGAVGNNGSGLTGLNWSVRIMALRAWSEDWTYPSPTFQFLTHAVAAFDYVLVMRKRGVNIRVTSNSYASYIDSVALREAIARCGEAGILSVFAAGNEALNSDLFSSLPGAFNLTSVISVAASAENDTLTFFSNFGRSTVDIAAPGINMVSTWKNGEYQSGGGGTSFACPLVAGAAALLLSVKPDLAVDELKAALFGSVDQPLSFRGKLVTNGRLNVARALDYLTNENPASIVLTALPAGQRTPTNAPIQVTFNRPMNRASVESAFRIDPPVSGTFEWTSDGRSFVFHHDLLFDSTTNYTARISGAAQDGINGTLDGNFNRSPEGSPADDFVWTFRFLLPNDDFTNAVSLAGGSGVVQGNNRYATYEMSEQNHVHDRTSMSSLWYRWTPPAGGGWITFDLTSGTAFDSLLAVYTGATLEQLIPIGGNDNDGARTGSRVSFETTAGASYAVVVLGKSADTTKRVVGANQTGPFKLSWYPTPTPRFARTEFSPSSGAAGAMVTLNGTNLTGATAVLFNGTQAPVDTTLGDYSDLRLTAYVPLDATSGAITIVTPHGNATSTDAFTLLPLDVAPPVVAGI